jgi:hypothetical protein
VGTLYIYNLCTGEVYHYGFLVTVATNFGASIGCLNANCIVGHEQGSSHCFSVTCLFCMNHDSILMYICEVWYTIHIKETVYDSQLVGVIRQLRHFRISR